MTTGFIINRLFREYGTTLDLDEIERRLYTLPTWKLVHPETGKRVQLVNHPSWQPLYLLMLKQGWIDDEMSNNGNTQPEDTGGAFADD